MIKDDIKKNIEKLSLDMNRDIRDNLLMIKLETIDYLCETNKITSMAELGSVWGVDCGYGLYALKKYGLKKLLEIDTNWNENAKRICASNHEISILEANFGSKAAINFMAKHGRVDAIVFFDVLIHQVAPDWQRILQIYSEYAQHCIIVEPIFKASPISVRLLDLGKEDYFKNVPHDAEHPTYAQVFEKMYEIHPQHNRIWRDVHHVWQWGITQSDLMHTMKDLGFSLQYMKNTGKYFHLDNYDYISYVFSKNIS